MKIVCAIRFDYVDEIALNDMKTSGNVLFESNLGTTQVFGLFSSLLRI